MEAKCDNCDTTYDYRELVDIDEFWERAPEPGEPMPAGQCPDSDCGALCFVVKPEAWKNNGIQFSRLISEIAATQTLDLAALADSMDLSVEHVDELFERAFVAFQQITANLPASKQ